MSARSRALDVLADHWEYLARQTDRWDMELTPMYTAKDVYLQAAEMTRKTALDNRWRDRVMTAWYKITGTGGY